MSTVNDNSTLDAACSAAMRLQLVGQLDQAADAYRSILLADPTHAAASHCLGMLKVQLREPAAGVPLLLTALTAQPESPDYWLGYLEALLQSGDSDTAHETLALGRQHGLAGKAAEEFTARLAKTATRPFLIAAPVYSHHSAGIRVLHTMCNELNLCGYPAYLIFFKFLPGKVEFFTSDDPCFYWDAHRHVQRLPASQDMSQFRDLINDAIVIYPEVIQGNPLNAPRVARYVLNHPEANRYPMLEGESDFIVSFLSRYWKKPHAVASIFVEEPVFTDDDTRPPLERTMDCTYIGKGAEYGQCFKIPGSVLIARHWPADKESLAQILRNTRYFFTWDVNTQTNADALMCGAIIVVPRWAPLGPECFNTDFGPIPYAESSMENGMLNIAELPSDYEEKRSAVIDSLRSTASRRTETVCRLAREVIQYFVGLNASRNVSSNATKRHKAQA